MPVEIGREDFLDNYWEYEPGQHVLVVAPTGAGKSHLCWQLAERTMQDHPSLRFVSYMPKPQDPTTVANIRKLGLKETATWPPRKPGMFDQKPTGYVLWPKHPNGPGVTAEARRESVGEQLRKGLNDQYWGGRSISFVDDAHSAATMMGLNPLIEEVLVNGRAAGAGMWMATQRPKGTLVSGGLTSYAYSSASKMFFSRDNDQNNLDRLSEIGAGFDPKEVASWIKDLRVYRMGETTIGDFLYLDRGGYAAIVTPW